MLTEAKLIKNDEMINGKKIRRKCGQYKFGGDLEKRQKKRPATQNIVRKMLSNKQETTGLSKTNTHIYQFSSFFQIFLTKFAQKEYFRSKTKKVNTTTDFYILDFSLRFELLF